MGIQNIIQKYKHAWVLLYGLIYIPWFLYLEKHITSDYNIIHVNLDDKIPFIEYFIVPYLLWFAFIALTIGVFFVTDKAGFYKLTLFLFTGMTIFLVISTIYPNGLALRPDTFARDNIFVDMVKSLYKADTPTNVLPSLHVFNSLGAYIAIAQSERLKNIKIIHRSALVLTILIILATMFLKQHSVIDVIAAGIIAMVLYPFIYAPTLKQSEHFSKQPV